VENTGDRQGSYAVPFVIDGKTEVRENVTLSGGEKTQVSYIRSFNNVGTYTVGIADKQVGEVEVAPPPVIELQEAELIDTRIDSGQMITPTPRLSIVFENTGGSTGTVPVDIEVGGQKVGIISSSEVTVKPGNKKRVNASYRLETNDGGYVNDGEHEVTVNGEPAGTLIVGRSNITVTDTSVNTTTITEGGAAALNITAENTGVVSGSKPVRIFLGEDRVSTVEIALEPDERGTATYVHTFNEAGEFTFEIRGETQTVSHSRAASDVRGL
jgi:hypothetical protein